MHAMLGWLLVSQFLTLGADAVVTEQEVRWTLEVVLPPDWQPGLLLPLTEPLTAQVEQPGPTVELRPIISAVGAVTGLEVVHARKKIRQGREVDVARVVLRTPRRDDALDAPRLQGAVLQRLLLEHGWRFAPSGDSLSQHVGFLSAASATHGERASVDALLGDRLSPPSSLRVYVTGSGNIPGRWHSPQEHLAHGAWLAAGLFPLALGALLWGHRRLSRDVMHQRVEAELAAAYRELER